MAVHAGVIFDLDGVIIDSEELQYKAYSQVLAPFGVRVPRDEYGREWIAAGRGPEYAVRAYGLPVTPDQLRELKDPVYHEILRREVTLLPGAAAALSRLGRRFALALATNSNRVDAGFVLDHFDLRRFFAAVVTRDLYARAKPEPDAFVTAARRLDLPPERCVVVEDAFKGVLAASRAGCKCIAVPNGFTQDNDFRLAARIVRSLDDVTEELIEELVAAPGDPR